MKLAHITPLIKGLGLDQAELKNYRPISNLSFVGKLIERVVLSRLNNYLQENNLNMGIIDEWIFVAEGNLDRHLGISSTFLIILIFKILK